ncbi:MAG: response regulator transcription factor [Eubacteriales bacterium]|nr:response regulator transcription factor [Clostridiales bacterium]MDD7308279.1 response regulator transcription factor [Eubacteriales bacterium]MDY2933194.1 response regulator transcription factor [Anaerovoracaceae bacterium]
MYRIYIIEDDSIIAGKIKEHMTNWGFEARCASDFRNIMGEFAEYDPHMVLLDISLPFFNGYHWCEEIRRVSKVPVIFLSSAADNMNIIMAMSMGGDDFIAKPFDMNVLVAKVQAVLRRTYDFGGQTQVIEHRGALLNMSDASLVYNGEPVELTRNDYKILLTLMENRGSIVSRETLMEKLWETDCFVDENTLTVNIARLRKKLDSAGLTGFITTKKGIGYIVE